MDPTITEWIKSGGAFGLVGLLLWFYRRDWKTLTEYWQQQNSMLMTIVKTNTEELGKMQSSVRLMHDETRADNEAIRTRIHELAQVMSPITPQAALILSRLDILLGDLQERRYER